MSGLPVEQIILRIERTDPEILRASAKAFDAAAEQFATVRGRMLGVIADTGPMLPMLGELTAAEEAQVAVAARQLYQWNQTKTA